MTKEFWEKAEKMTPEERKAARQTQWASAIQDFWKEHDEKEKYRSKGHKLMTCQEFDKESVCRKDDDWWQNRGLDQIITSYVRNQIRGLRYNHRELISELMEIEMFCMRGASSSEDAMRFAILRRNHLLAYREIRAELDPDWESHEDGSIAEWDWKVQEDEDRRSNAEQERILRIQQDQMIWKELGGEPRMTWARAIFKFNERRSDESRQI